MPSLARSICTDKQSGQEHCCSVETYLKYTTSQVVLTTYLLVDIVECLCGNTGSQRVPMEQIHHTQFHAFQTKQLACNLHWNEYLWLSLGMEMTDFPTEIIVTLFL
jgi:hypothetical protein